VTRFSQDGVEYEPEMNGDISVEFVKNDVKITHGDLL